MFSLIESKSEIASAQKKLERSFQRDFKTRATKNIGFPGDTLEKTIVITDGKYWYWKSDAKEKGRSNPRYLNWLGLYREGFDLQISVEINTPYEGINGRIAGFFARDSTTRRTYLLHSGRVGGGTKGVSKSEFLVWSSQKLVDVIDSKGKVRKGALVMPIDGIAATRSAQRYVQIIAEFKEAVRAGKTSTKQFRDRVNAFNDYYSEASGRRQGSRKSEIDYISRHGEVVEALHNWRKAKGTSKGRRIVKHSLIDLGIAANNALIEIYEVKTSTARQDVYTAIGQLFVHAPASGCKRTIVLPKREHLAKDLASALRRNNIEAIYFELTENAVTICEAPPR